MITTTWQLSWSNCLHWSWSYNRQSKSWFGVMEGSKENLVALQQKQYMEIKVFIFPPHHSHSLCNGHFGIGKHCLYQFAINNMQDAFSSFKNTTTTILQQIPQHEPTKEPVPGTWLHPTGPPTIIFRTTKEALSPNQRKPVLKVLVLGGSNVGKTSLLVRYCQDQFSERNRSTIGCDFLNKHITVQERGITLQVWDTAGQGKPTTSQKNKHPTPNKHMMVERFESMGEALFRGTDGLVLSCDLSKPRGKVASTGEPIESWHFEFFARVLPHTCLPPSVTTNSCMY